MKKQTAFPNVLPSPEKPIHLSTEIKWLSGEGCGSWFHIKVQDDGYLISRYSPDGALECSGLFRQTLGKPFKISEEYSYTYLSHCAEVNIIQNSQKLTFKAVAKLPL